MVPMCTLLFAALAAAGALGAPPPSFFNCSSQPAGAFEPVKLRNTQGIEATMIAYGATMTHLLVPDRFGVQRDVLLGWDDLTEYCTNAEHTYFGATIGRIANRIGNCSFDFDGKHYDLPCNNGGIDTLHGGTVGYDRRVWTPVDRTSNSVTWVYFSPDGEMGFPGDLSIKVTHTITESNEWLIEYSAVAGEKPSVAALTNHAYFNLNANVDNTPTVLEHVLHMPSATRVVEVTGAPDYDLVPTGAILSIPAGSALDFTQAKELGRDIDHGVVSANGGYDNAYVFDKSASPADVAATLYSPITGIQLEMYTDQPSVQVFSGNSFNSTDVDPLSKSHRLRRKKSQTFGDEPQYYHYRGAVCLEAGQLPDAVNHRNFPSVRIGAGGQYKQRTSYKFSNVGIIQV